MKKECKLIIQDEVNVKIEGLDPVVRRKLVSALKYEIPGARFMPSVKMGRWDGKQSFCTIGGNTYINLLDVVLPIIEEAGYSFTEVQDLRIEHNIKFPKVDKNLFDGKVWAKGHDLEGQPIELWDHQVECINNFLENLQCVQEISTGAGKTILAAALSYLVEKHTDGRTIVIVPNKDLIRQTQLDYVNVGLDVGVYYGDRKDIGNQHTICTWQSLNNLEKLGEIDGLNVLQAFLDQVNCVICDEVHGVKADILHKMLTRHMGHIPIRWGMSGTLPEYEFQEKALLTGVGETVNELTAKELQDIGVLANCHVDIIQLQDSGEYKSYPEEQKYLLTNPARMKYIAESIQKIAETGNTLILVDRIKAGELLEDFVDNSIFLSGSDNSNTRKENYDKVNQGTNEIVIATYGIAAVGINIPRIFNLVLVESGKSYIKVIQSIGRGIRRAKDKDFVQIYDFTSSLKYSKRHLTKRKSFYRKVSYPFTVTKVNY